MALKDWNDFKGTAKKIEDMDLPRIGKKIGVGEDVIHGVLDCETGGTGGFDSQGRPKLLFEPHVFYRELPQAERNTAVRQGLAYPKWKRGYPKESYTRLKKAIAINEKAALRSASWGLGQIMGFNHKAAGYPFVQDFVRAMMADEDLHLEAMVNFIKNTHLDDELRVLEKKLKSGQKITGDDARPFVRGYNGAEYAKNNYHTRFAASLNKWAKIKDTPYVETAETPVEAAVEEENVYDGKFHQALFNLQERLDKLGYPEVGSVDGKWGTKTRAAIFAFQADNGMDPTGKVDEALLAAVMVAEPRKISEARKETTTADLRAEGAEEINRADKTEIAGYGTAALGAAAAAEKTGLLDTAKESSGYIQQVLDMVDPFKDFIVSNIWLVLGGLGVVIVWQQWKAKQLRVEKHRNATDVSL